MSKKKSAKITFQIDKEKNFPEWYDEILEKAEIIDKRYPVKGMPVLMPYGYQIFENIIKKLEELWNKTGHKKVLFPTLIPYTLFKKEADHIKGFEEQVFWVTKAGDRNLKELLILRPTSEVPIYYMFSLWIRSHKDLPLKIYQTCTVFRYETKATKPLIRVREIPWNEAHTAHATREDAERQIKEAWRCYDELFINWLCIHGLKLVRPEWDKFPGAEYSVTLDILMPDGKVLQAVGNHFLGQKFSKVFDISFETKDGRRDYVYQTCYGISTRTVAAVLAVHGDNNGLILPYTVAPIQVVIVPIPYKEREEDVLEKCRKVEKLLKKKGVRTFLDDRDETPGNKFYFWEMKGVPVRIEIGPRDVDNGTVTICKRYNREKIQVKDEELMEVLEKVFEDIMNYLRERSREKLEKSIVNVKTLDELKEAIGKGLIARAPFCSIEMDGYKCAQYIKENIGGEVRGIKFQEKETPEKGDKCIVCGKEAKYIVYIAKSY